jgi:hypothetical protein
MTASEPPFKKKNLLANSIFRADPLDEAACLIALLAVRSA